MNLKHWYGTLAKYNAVATKDSGTLYHCSEGQIYRGSVLLATRRWGDLSGVPSTFAPSSHTHDDRYYTETEVNTLLTNNYAAKAQTMYIGTTAVNINRPSGALALTGISSIAPIYISDNKVGVGTGSPSQRLDVVGAGNFTTKVITGGYNYTAQTAGLGIGTDGALNGVTFYNGTGVSGRIYRNGDILYFNRGGDTSKGFYLTAAGVLTHGGNFSVLGDVTGLLKLTGGLQSANNKISLHNTSYTFASHSDNSLELHSSRIVTRSSDTSLPGLITQAYTAEAQTYGADMLFDVQKTTGGVFSDLSKAAFVFSTGWSTHLLRIFRGGDVVVAGSIGTSTADGASVRVGLTRILYDSSIGGVHFLKNAGGYSPIRSGAITASGEMQATGFYQTSLRSAKRDIKFFDQSALDVIRDVDVVSYRYKAQTSDETHIGYIADDTHELLSGKKHDHANQGNAIGLLLKAVQELEKQNKVLLDQIKSLRP